MIYDFMSIMYIPWVEKYKQEKILNFENPTKGFGNPILSRSLFDVQTLV